MDYSNVNWQNPEEAIQFFEQHQIELMNIKHSNDLEDILKIHGHYMYALNQKTHYSKGLDHVMALSEKVDELGENAISQEYQNGILLYQGIFNSKLKKYQDAYPIFKQLSENDPESHLYREWLNHTKFIRLNWAFNAFYILGVALILLDITFDTTVSILNETGLVVLALTFFSQSYLERKYKKEVNKKS